MATLKVTNLTAGPIAVGDVTGYGASFTVPGSGYPLWKPGETVVAGNRRTISSTGYVAECITGGTTSATTVPTIATNSTDVTDNTAHWKYYGAAPSVSVALTSRQLEDVGRQLDTVKTSILVDITDDSVNNDVTEALAAGRPFVIYKKLATGTGEGDDKVFDNVPARFRVLDFMFMESNSVNAATVKLFSDTLHTGVQYGPTLATGNATKQVFRQSGTSAASFVVEEYKGLYINRSDRTETGELVLWCIPE